MITLLLLSNIYILRTLITLNLRSLWNVFFNLKKRSYFLIIFLNLLI